jgi:hypothetical protein
MNYYKYLLFCILAFSFIKYQYHLRTDAIAQIIIGCVVIVIILDYIEIDKLTADLPFMNNNATVKPEAYDSEETSQKNERSYIDNDSLELLYEDKNNEDDYSEQVRTPPYLNF